MNEPQVVLSLFPGIGMLDQAFEEEGFCVLRGPDLLWGGDIKRFHMPPGRVDGVIGGPPCQAFSRMVHMVRQNGFEPAENLIPEFERVVSEARPTWFAMEQVPAAPLPKVAGYWTRDCLLNNRWLGEEQNRLRRFTFGTIHSGVDDRFDLSCEQVALENPRFAQAVCASGAARSVPVARGGSGKVKASRRCRAGDLKTVASFDTAKRLQGLPDDFDLPGMTVAAKIRAVGNGVPRKMGRAVARAVRRALGLPILGAS